MILGHNRLQELNLVSPLLEDTIREAGLDLRIDHMLGEISSVPAGSEDETIIVYPKSFLLTLTKEIIRLPRNLIGFCNLRSSLARQGILIPPTIVDPGFEGKLVIELVNMGSATIYWELMI